MLITRCCTGCQGSFPTTKGHRPYLADGSRMFLCFTCYGSYRAQNPADDHDSKLDGPEAEAKFAALMDVGYYQHCAFNKEWRTRVG